MADIKQVALRLSVGTYEQVRLAAEARGVSVHSELVRRIEQAGFAVTGEPAPAPRVAGSIPEVAVPIAPKVVPAVPTVAKYVEEQFVQDLAKKDVQTFFRPAAKERKGDWRDK